MASVTKRGNGYLARVRKQGFKPVSQTFIKRSDAMAWGRRVEADMQAGRWVETKDVVPTLGEAIRLYRTVVASRLKGARDYAYSFKEIEASTLASRPLNQVRPADLAAWRDALSARGLKNATVARRLGLLSGVLTWCQKERGWIDTNPMHAVRKPVVRDGRTRTLDDEEVRCLHLATGGSRAAWLPDALTVLLRTAMRRSELVALRRADVDLAHGVARLHDSKNGQAREVPLCPQAMQALARLMAMTAASRSPGVLPINDPEAISFAFRRAVARARHRHAQDCAARGAQPEPGFLAGVRLHDLRHHAISTWARTGALSLVELMAISGHKSPRMLMRYAHLDAGSLAKRLAAIAADGGHGAAATPAVPAGRVRAEDAA